MEIKEQIIQEYLASGCGYRKLQAKYGISRTIICKWVQVYQGIHNLAPTDLQTKHYKNSMERKQKNKPDIKSSIIGFYKSIIYKLDYQITTNHLWETKSFMTKSQLNDVTQTTDYHSDGKGNWFVNGQHIEKFNGCIDIDISLTPFTNTLPINRLKLSEKTNKHIQVLYVDILGQETNSVRQKYTRLSPNEYKYENVPNDFEFIVTVDELGLVVKYPELYERAYTIKSNYR